MARRKTSKAAKPTKAVKAVPFTGKLDTVREILEAAKLFRAAEHFPRWDTFTVADVRDKSYSEEWNYYVERNLFNFQLMDLSLLQFKWRVLDGERCASFSWVEFPFLVPTLEEFTRENNLAAEDAPTYYENFVMDDPEVKQSPVPIRYDYAPDEYSPGRHPASHLHLGVDSEIRIGTKKRFSAVTFTLLVIRQVYPERWAELLKWEGFAAQAAEVRSSLDSVPPAFFGAADEHEHQLQ